MSNIIPDFNSLMSGYVPQQQAVANPFQRASAVRPDIVAPGNMGTLPSDSYNQLAQFGGVGYAPAAFDFTGNDAGYYGHGNYIRSPLMQRYLQPTAQNGAWLYSALTNAMPGWQTVANPGQNPFWTASGSAPLFPTNRPGGMAYNPKDLPGVNGNPYLSMWPYQNSNQAAGQPVARPAAPSSGGQYQPTRSFYDMVNATLGARQMAQPGQQGYNLESSPNTRAAAKVDAARMAQAMGRPLTWAERRQLDQRQQGWGFAPVGG